MTSNTFRGHIGRDTDGESIATETTTDRFPSLTNSQCRDVLHFVALEGWTTDLEIRRSVDFSRAQHKECLTKLAKDGFIEFVGTVERQFLRLTPRGIWAADTQEGDGAETATEVEA